MTVPERKAALDRDLRNAIKRIADPSIRGHYGEAIKQLRWDLFNQHRKKPDQKFGQKSGFNKWKPGPEPALAATKGSLLAAGSGAVDEVLREAVILATLITHPDLIETFLAPLERLTMVVPDHRTMLASLLSTDFDGAADLRDKLETAIGVTPVEKLFALKHVTIATAMRHPQDAEMGRALFGRGIGQAGSHPGRNPRGRRGGGGHGRDGRRRA